MLRPPPLAGTRRCSASFDRGNYLPVPTEAMPMDNRQQSTTLFIPESSSVTEIDSTATTTLAAAEPNGFDPKFRRSSMFIVSSDILRVSGYTNQFKNLLSTRSRRESGPGGLAGCQQLSLGWLSFEKYSFPHSANEMQRLH
ncbi:hypothetical protein Ddc_08972 [Ditylenchus destructor]|nr:hypothetical protein Ddc_08972 [Ditylenchus destructor]